MNKKNLSAKNSLLQKKVALVWRLWVRYFRFFLGLLFFLALGFVVYVWYENLYNLDKGADDRNAQLEQRTKEVEFDEASFTQIVETVEERRKEMTQKTEGVNDIFFSDQIPTQGDDQGEPEPVIEDTAEEDQQVETVVEESVSVNETEEVQEEIVEDVNDPDVAAEEV